MKILTALAFLFFTAGVMSGRGETFVGCGPDPSCGGTELTIFKNGAKITFIEYSIGQSNRMVNTRWQLLKNGEWQVSVQVSSFRLTEDGSVTDYHASSRHTFRAKAVRRGKETAQKLGWDEDNWEQEAARLMRHFQDHQNDFVKTPTVNWVRG